MSKASRNSLRTQTAWRLVRILIPSPSPSPSPAIPIPIGEGEGTALTINGFFIVAHRYEGPIARVLPTKTASLRLHPAGIGGDRARDRARAGEGEQVPISDTAWVGGNRTHAACRINASASDP